MPHTFSEHVWHLHELLRDVHGMRLEALAALAADAAHWWSQRSGLPLPVGIPEPSLLQSAVPQEALDLQRRWLDHSTEEEVRGYLPALAYKGQSDDTGEHLSSLSMSRVATVATLARRRSGEPTLTLYDPACGSGAMLHEVARALEGHGFRPSLIGQDINSTAAILGAATLFVGGFEADIRTGNSLIDDPFADRQVDVAVCQPPLGLSWHRDAAAVQRRREGGWFPFGLPALNDGTWLFVSRLIEKLRAPVDGGGRVVAFAAPGALQDQAASPIRMAILEQDLLEAIVGLPNGLSPNTSVFLYALVFSNNKPERRKGKVQLINLRAYFETSRERRGARRTLRNEALDVLERALNTIRSGIASRTVPIEHLMRRRITVTRRASESAQAISEPHARFKWQVDVPANESVEEFLARRYGPVPTIVIDESDRIRCQLEIDSAFDRTFERLRGWLASQEWDATRMSALLVTAPEALKLDASLDALTDPNLVLLPTSTDADATVTAEGPATSGARTLLVSVDPERISAEFLAGWLNSPLGRDCRRRASDMARSGSVIMAVRTDGRSLQRYIDELLIPVPPPSTQHALEAANARFAAASRMVENAQREFWTSPGRRTELVRRFDPLFDKTFVTWTNELPYPIASSLWTLESKRPNVEAAHKQMFLVWEAYTAFTGTVLLSALHQDPALYESEVSQLREALAKAQLTMERATLGSWSLIVQRMCARFRNLLAGTDTDERARVLQTFGSPSQTTLSRLLDPAVVQLISDASAKRNLWDGHTGALTEIELRHNLDYMYARLEELRDVVGSSWKELLCVRARSVAKRKGRQFQTVELVMGPSTPFQLDEIIVGETMEEGELHLATHESARPLPLQHLVLLRNSTGSARYACYFYNRLEGEKIRIVSYHLADRSEVIERLDDVFAAVRDLLPQATVAMDGA